MTRHAFVVVLQALLVLCWATNANAAASAAGEPRGEVKGSAWTHDAGSAIAVVNNALVALPPAVTGGAIYLGPYAGAPTQVSGKAPVVVFLHGSSGLGLKAIAEWQRWLAGLGIASMAPDSFALKDRLTYTSPVGKDVYEHIHVLRGSEIALAVHALESAPWADRGRMMLAGASEGAVAVARYAGDEFRGRILYSWSCEDNYFVEHHGTARPGDQPVLNIMSSTDPYFSPSNAWLGNPSALGHCGQVLKANRHAVVVLLPGAPHTLMNLPAARAATEAFLQEFLLP